MGEQNPSTLLHRQMSLFCRSLQYTCLPWKVGFQGNDSRRLAGLWRGWPGPPRSSPQQMPARPSLSRRPSRLEARGCGSALRPWDLAARTPLACFCGRSRALGKLLGPKRREGKKGGEKRRRGPGGQQPQPAGE
ncbi:uncharacterized protein LOC101037063 [Saimiri boliviensis]|uniref:uncharacterized protein LOC101037063 n=1 Tax=Saimiri boliviensis TaxID=27679 RepID=UPI003D771079